MRLFISKLCLTSLIGFSMMSIILGAFFITFHAPNQKAEQFMLKAYSLYDQANEMDDIETANILLKSAQNMALQAHKYTPDSMVIAREVKFFEAAQASLEKQKTILTQAEYSSQ